MLNPCIELCYHRYRKQYTSDCDDKCEYAKVIKENKELKAAMQKVFDVAFSDNAEEKKQESFIENCCVSDNCSKTGCYRYFVCKKEFGK